MGKTSPISLTIQSQKTDRKRSVGSRHTSHNSSYSSVFLVFFFPTKEWLPLQCETRPEYRRLTSGFAEGRAGQHCSMLQSAERAKFVHTSHSSRGRYHMSSRPKEKKASETISGPARSRLFSLTRLRGQQPRQAFPKLLQQLMIRPQRLAAAGPP